MLKPLRRFAVVIALSLAALVVPSAAQALTQSDVDTTFGKGGFADAGVAASSFGARIAVQADGKIVAAVIPASGSPLVARYTVDGAPDSSFGSGGTATLASLGATNPNVSRVLIAADGTIYVVGSGEIAGTDRGAIWSFNSSGAPNPTFNGTGSKLFPALSASDSGFSDAALMPDGNIATASEETPAADTQIAIRVVTPTGALPVSTSKLFAGYDAQPTSIAVLPSGRIVVAMMAQNAGTIVSAFIAFTSLGVYEASWASAGVLNFGLPVPMLSTAYRLVVANNELTAIGHVGYTPAVERFSADGAPLPAYGAYGFIRFLPLGQSLAYSIDGGVVDGYKTVSVGAGAQSATPVPYVARTNADGSMDTGFAPGGAVQVPFAGAAATGFARQPSGKYIIALSGPSGKLTFTRLWGDAAPPQPATTRFSSALKSKLASSKARTIRGTTGGSGVVKVELAIQRVDSKLLKRSKKCTYVTSTKGATKNYKAIGGKCQPGRWLAATGTSFWSLKLTKSLAPGKYVFTARATGFLGIGVSTSKNITLTK